MAAATAAVDAAEAARRAAAVRERVAEAVERSAARREWLGTFVRAEEAGHALELRRAPERRRADLAWEMTAAEAAQRRVAAANAAHPKAKPVIVWDFIDFHPLNSEIIPPMGVGTGKLHYWADGTHGLETLGNAMLARMNGWEILDPKEADYGTIINSANLQSRLSDLRNQYDRYREGHPEEFKFVAESVLRYADDKSEPKGEEDGRDPPP
jgi:hypothetical protein